MLWKNIVDVVKAEGEIKEGAKEALDFFKKKDLKLALASASSMVLIDAVLEKIGIREYFEEIYSAQFEPEGKPHPGVYLTTAKKLGVLPQHCLAIEDSINGIKSAKAAGMKCLAIPEDISDRNTDIADLKISSFREINDDLWREVDKF